VLSGVDGGNNKKGYTGEYAYLTSATKRTGASSEDRKRIAELKTELEKANEDNQKVRATVKEFLAGMKAEKGDKSKKGKAAQKAKLIEQLPQRFQKQLKQAQQRIDDVTAEIQQLENKSSSASEPVMAVRDSSSPENCRINIRGEVNDLGDMVPRGFVRVLTDPSSPDVNPQQSGRLQLAAWMTSKRNPLPARVMANRVWYHLFGRGIVPTVDNFGALGEAPTNQPLLDYLAVRFMDGGWSVKKLIREVMLSHAYQLGSDHSDAGYAADPELVTGQRDVTTIAPQALYMMNSPVVLQQSEIVTNHLLSDSRLSDDAARVDHVFRLILGHPADAQQRADVLAFLSNYETTLPSDMKPSQRRIEAWTSVCQTLLASAEFRYVY